MASTPIRQELHITVEDEAQALIALLAERSGLSRQLLKQAMDKGALWRTRGANTRRLRRVKTPLQRGEVLHLYFDSEILGRTVPPAELISQQDGYSLWYKPYGMDCQGSKWGDHCTIVRSVVKQTGGKALLVHRLDRAATGLIIVAQEKNTAASLSELFRERQVAKTYQAIVHGLHPALDSELSIVQDLDGKSAVSHVRALQQDTAACRSLLQVRIETGRKHQIRRHLCESGYPIVGDRLYGSGNDPEDLQLCAIRLAFRCPKTGQQQRFELDAARQLTL